MAKTKKRCRNQSTTTWDAVDHAMHTAKQPKKSRLERTALLTHDTKEKHDAMKLKLHITKARKDVESLRHRLQNWDPVQYEKEQAEKIMHPEEQPPKKKGRKGPETWKLKGAARPAWQVYDFDTRYVDPYSTAHEAARVKAARIQNLLALFRGSFGQNDRPEICREYLGALMRLGNLHFENKQYKSARQVFLECIELEGEEQENPITAARESLMELYMEIKKYDSAVRLGERFPTDTSVCLRYSAALAAMQLQTDTVEDVMAKAIRSNVFTAYYLCYHDTFASVMEYLDDIQNADDGPQSSFEEALEYCGNEETIEQWLQVPNSIPTLKQVLQSGINGTHTSLQVSDLDWNARLEKIEQDYHDRQTRINKDNNNATNLPSEVEEHDTTTSATDGVVDVPMFAKMFRTAMEILEHSRKNT